MPKGSYPANITRGFTRRIFDLEPSFYEGKRILDIGCGPCGSLEWADMAAERVGLDPLVPQSMELGAKKHEMTYVAAPSEKIPFPMALLTWYVRSTVSITLQTWSTLCLR